MSVVVAFSGALAPDWIDDLFIALSVLVPAAVLFAGRDAARRPDGKGG